VCAETGQEKEERKQKKMKKLAKRMSKLTKKAKKEQKRQEKKARKERRKKKAKKSRARRALEFICPCCAEGDYPVSRRDLLYSLVIFLQLLTFISRLLFFKVIIFPHMLHM